MNNTSKNKMFLSYNEAKVFIHTLKLKNRHEWRQYCKSRNNLSNIPLAPDIVYKNKGWISWGDWLGNSNKSFKEKNKHLSSFEDAKKFVHKLKLKGVSEWHQYCKSGNKPENIPATPHGVYKNKGWISYGDWLGTNYIATVNRQYVSFEEAKKVAKKTGIKSSSQWKQYCKLNNNLPSNPNRHYKCEGWISWYHFLNTKRNYNDLYQDAKLFVHTLNLKTGKEWYQYCKSGNKPENIPANPHNVYKNKGWISWSDWLGINKKWISFEDAKKVLKTYN